jgi:hypothetical protein
VENIATTGLWDKTNNDVCLYISQATIEANYNYFSSDEYKTCSLHAFSKNETQTSDSVFIDNLKNWMLLRKRSSILISGTNEEIRIAFFKKQRELIENL